MRVARPAGKTLSAVQASGQLHPQLDAAGTLLIVLGDSWAPARDARLWLPKAADRQLPASCADMMGAPAWSPVRAESAQALLRLCDTARGPDVGRLAACALGLSRAGVVGPDAVYRTSLSTQ